MNDDEQNAVLEIRDAAVAWWHAHREYWQAITFHGVNGELSPTAIGLLSVMEGPVTRQMEVTIRRAEELLGIEPAELVPQVIVAENVTR